MKSFVFLASIEGDLLILAGISSLLKTIFPQNKNVLLLPKFPRVYPRINDYKSFFDEIIDVDAVFFGLHPTMVFNNISKIRKLYKRLAPYRKSVYFLFDIYNLVELAVYSFIKKNKDAQMITVTAFEEHIDINNLECLLRRTIIKSIYSILLTRQMFFEFRIRNTENEGINYLRAYTQIQLCINNSGCRNKYKKSFEKLPYPASFIMNNRSGHLAKYEFIEPYSVILFVDSQVSHWIDDYWHKIDKFLEILEMKGISIYVKDHPNCTRSGANLLKSEKIRIIPKEITAELIFISNAHNIVGVFGHGSTSLITASWLGIPAFDIGEYMEFDRNLLKKWVQFLKLGRGITRIKCLEDVKEVDFATGVHRDFSVMENEKIWRDIFVEEFSETV